MSRAKPAGYWVDAQTLTNIRNEARSEAREIDRIYRSFGHSTELTERSRRNVVIQALLLHIDAQRSLIVRLQRYLVGAVKGRPSYEARGAAKTIEALQRKKRR